MTSEPETIKVLYRKEFKPYTKEWTILAVFPELTDDYRGFLMVGYARIGQHTSVSPDYLRKTKPATPEEFAELHREVKSIYETSLCPDDPIYKLQVIQRVPNNARKKRRDQAAAFRAGGSPD